MVDEYINILTENLADPVLLYNEFKIEVFYYFFTFLSQFFVSKIDH